MERFLIRLSKAVRCITRTRSGSPAAWRKRGCELYNDPSKQTKVLKAARAAYATSDTLFIFNGGREPTDETRWWAVIQTEVLWREQRLLFLSASFGLHLRESLSVEWSPPTLLCNLFQGRKGRADGYLAADKNPSERSYQVASGHTVI